MSGKEHTHHSPAPPRSAKPNCRLRIENNDRPDRLTIESSHIQTNQSTLQSIGHGPFCLQTHYTAPSLFQLVARSLYLSNRCISTGLVFREGICQSPLQERDHMQPANTWLLCVMHLRNSVVLEKTRLLTSTEKLQQWNKPWPKKLEIMPVAELTSRKSDILRRNKKSNMNGSYDPRPPEYRKLLVIRLLRNYIVTYYLLINHQLS